MGLFDRLRGDEPGRVAVLGVAGLPFSLASGPDPLLPSIAAFADAGRATAIESVLPPDESACWPALTAGRNPGYTGVYGLLDREVGTYDTYVPQGGDVQVDRLWDHVEAADRSTTVLNVPVTNPPQKEVGRMAAGPQAPDLDRAAQPAELRRYLADSDYRLDVDAGLGQEGEAGSLITDARETMAARFEAFERYGESDDWALFVGCVTAPDRLNHFVWDSLRGDGGLQGEVRSFYSALDDHLESFREVLDEEVTFVLVGDHGFASLSYEVDCQRWLEQEGWLEWGEEPGQLEDISAETRAFAFPHGRFYLNRVDREPDGTVADDEVETVTRELIAALEDLRGPDGERVISAVYRGADIYDGPHTDLAPDLVAVPEPGFDLTTSFDGRGEVFSVGRRVGMHTPKDAPLVIDHPDVDLTDASPFDVAPTVLELLDVAVDSSAFDGTSLV